MILKFVHIAIYTLLQVLIKSTAATNQTVISRLGTFPIRMLRLGRPLSTDSELGMLGPQRPLSAYNATVFHSTFNLQRILTIFYKIQL